MLLSIDPNQIPSKFISEEFRFLGILPSYGWLVCMCVRIRTCFKLAVADPFYACSLSPKDGFCRSKQLQIRNSYWFTFAGVSLLTLCPCRRLLQFAFLNQNLLWSCCCQHSLCSFLIPKDWFSSAHCDWIVKPFRS
jgi:hypothetical protein